MNKDILKDINNCSDCVEILDIIDNYVREELENYPYCNYKEKLPPVKNAPQFCDKYGVEIRATLYKTNPDLKYCFDSRTGNCIITNVRIDPSNLKNASRIYKRKEKDKEYLYGDVVINKIYGETVYKYWKHLIDNDFVFATENQKYKNELENKLNRSYYAKLVIDTYFNNEIKNNRILVNK